MIVKLQNPKQYDLIIFDGKSLDDLKYLIKDKKYFVIENRKERIKEIYCGINFIISFIINFFLFFFKAKNFHTIYLYTLIKKINPKIIITSIDNSFKFSDLSKLLKEEINFFAVQNASREDFAQNDYNLKKKIITKDLNKLYYNIPNFFCYGQYEIDSALKYKIKIDKFYKVGSLRLANFFQYVKDEGLKINKNKYDICLISEGGIDSYDKLFHTQSVNESFANIAKLTIQFVKKNNLKFIFLRKFYGKDFSKELNFYKNYLDNEDLNFLIKNSFSKNNPFSYESYFGLMESKVAIGAQSTLLRDKIGCKEKILSLTIPQLEFFHFPLNGICKLNSFDYDNFEHRLNYILNISIDEYVSKIDKKISYLIEFDKNYSAIDKIKDKLNF